eukprot:TRINITY_DN6373_c0_g1_i2.p1 TRINITY_DN6373_c0_g1~~TRINITY_DN6373_c0_g1_i2.p1  ORF type:complete len:339 (-),score=88.95 TRINITY_DN6373_c0_g1_i2:1179-2195(-)
MVQQTPFVGDDSTFITGSKLSTVISVSTATGSTARLNGVCAGDVNTCKNATAPYDSPSNSSLLVVANEYKLSAVSLKSMKVVWSIAYSELLDVTNREENVVISSSHLGYDLCLKGLTTLKAVSQVLRSDDWEFNTEAPIIGVYQVIRGARLVKIKLCPEEIVEEQLTVYNYTSTLFAAESVVGQSVAEEYEGVSFPLIASSKFEEFDEPDDKSEITYTKLAIASLLGVLTALLACTLFSKFLQKTPAEPPQKPEKPEKPRQSVASTAQVGKLLICTDKILGYGSLGTIVYEGQFDHRTVAIKRMLRPFHEVATKEISALIVADNHPHVIRYFTKEEDR